jgi:hypothetical protein
MKAVRGTEARAIQHAKCGELEPEWGAGAGAV